LIAPISRERSWCDIGLGEPGGKCSYQPTMKVISCSMAAVIMMNSSNARGGDFEDLLASAESGDVAAQIEIAGIYSRGEGVAKDGGAALAWLTKAAEQDDSDAQYLLGDKFAAGDGVAKDPEEAVKWLTRSAEQGNTEAQIKLGSMYLASSGVPRSSKEAAKWFQMAANKNQAAAQCQLARMYMAGAGVTKSDVEGYKWATLSAAQDNEAAKKILVFLGQRMKPEELIEAKSMADGFLEVQTTDDTIESIPLIAPPLE
jgi:TPR repeat protein